MFLADLPTNGQRGRWPGLELAATTFLRDSWVFALSKLTNPLSHGTPTPIKTPYLVLWLSPNKLITCSLKLWFKPKFNPSHTPTRTGPPSSTNPHTILCENFLPILLSTRTSFLFVPALNTASSTSWHLLPWGSLASRTSRMTSAESTTL